MARRPAFVLAVPSSVLLASRSLATQAQGAAAVVAPGVQKEVLKQGTGEQARDGKKAVVHYTGSLTSGKVFDSSRTRGTPFQFTVGAGEVIKGWDVGVASMRVGEVAKFTLEPNMGYGSRGAGGIIPPNAVLIFEVELLELK